METVLSAFRRAQRAGKVLGVEEAFGRALKAPSRALDGLAGTWEELLLNQAVLALRKRGLPEPVTAPDPLFAKMILALKSCEEVPDDDPRPGTRPKPPA